MKNINLIIAIFLSIFILSGCLTVEKKDYKFEILKDGKVRLTINYYNIVSQDDDEKNVSFKDFGILITDYFEGEKILDDFEGATIIDKKLFEKDNILCGTVILEFPDIETAKIKRYNNKGPYMYYMGGFSETFETSNGEHGGEKFPVVFWDEDQTELTLSTVVTADVSATRPLIGHYKTWKENQ